LLLSTAALTQIGTRAKLFHDSGRTVEVVSEGTLAPLVGTCNQAGLDFIETQAGPTQMSPKVLNEHLAAARRFFSTAGETGGRVAPVRFDITVGVVAHRLHWADDDEASEIPIQ